VATVLASDPPAGGAGNSGLITAGNSKSNCIAIANDANDEHDVSMTNLAAAEKVSGVTFNCLETFATQSASWMNWENPWQFTHNSSWSDWISRGRDHQVILGLDLIPRSAPGSVSDPLEWERQGAAGDYDSYATQLAENLVADGAFADGRPLVVRLGIEANGNWEADYVGDTRAEAADWAKTYDNEVAAMRAVRGTNFLFVWNPNVTVSSGVSDLGSWYPGNSYVDIIGADIYDTDGANNETVAKEGWNALASDGAPSLNSIEAFAVAHGKPMSFPEWALVQGDDPAYVDAIGRIFKSGDFAFQSYFDVGDDGVIRLGSAIPRSVTAYRAEFGNRR
jgi:hypothetical protein